MEKQCSKCKEIKDIDEFHVSKVKVDGHAYSCKECRNTYARQKSRNSPKRPRSKRDPAREREGRLLRVFGIDNDRYNEMFALQAGKCDICGKHQMELNKRLCVDHCHETGKIRGLLCHSCNVAIGFLGDDIENLNCAIMYLNKHIAQ